MRLLNILRCKLIPQRVNNVSICSSANLFKESTCISLKINEKPHGRYYSDITPKHEVFNDFKTNQSKLSDLPLHKHTICALASGRAFKH